MKNPRSLLRFLVAGLCLCAGSACRSATNGAPIEYSLTDPQGQPMAEARVRVTHFDGKSLQFWASVENYTEQPLQLEADLRLKGREEVVFPPGRFAPVTSGEVPARSSIGFFLIFDLPPRFPLHQALGGELELELRGQVDGGSLTSMTKTFPVPEYHALGAAGGAGYTPVSPLSTSAPVRRGAKATQPPAAPPRPR